jgi:transcriptional regulator with XRE-family HTH domain
MPASKLVTQILARLQTLREAAGISEAELEERLILGPGWVGRIESGEAVPSIDILLVMLNEVGGSPSDLFGELEIDESGAELQRLLFGEADGDDLLIKFPYADHDATFRLQKASLIDFEEVLATLRNRLADLVRPGADDGAIKTDAVAQAFLKAVENWPHANPSDIWWFIIYRAYCDPFNHPAVYARLNLEQSWKRTGGWALEEVCVRFYGPYLKKKGINLVIATGNRKRDLLNQLEVSDRLEAAKVDIVLSGDTKDGEQCFGVVHVKASFAERRTDDVPMSQALIRAGYTSPLWTMDAKSGPSEHPENRGELGVALSEGDDRRSAKRKDIEDDKYFSVCFSYNANTIPTPKAQDAQARIVRCDFSKPNDAFARFIVAEWKRFRTER